MASELSTAGRAVSPPCPTSPSPLHVRFDDECVLIPAPSRPKALSKAYSLPLWRWKSSESDVPDDSHGKEDTHVTIKVPLPNFISKSHSPTRGRVVEPSTKPLSSCLVHRGGSIPPHRPTPRQPSVPVNSPDTATTIPLRACCSNCIHTTEQSLREGDHWQVKFSRGASRKRSKSLDTSTVHVVRGVNPSVSTSGLSAHVDAARVGPETSFGPVFRSVVSITVDEVDKRRKSERSVTGDGPTMHRRSSSDNSSHFGRGSSSSVESSAPDDSTPKTLAIQEEDEDQLFPLPSSPHRSPNASSNPSPSHSPTVSPVPSPNASMSSLGVGPSMGSSVDSSHAKSSSHDTLTSTCSSSSNDSSTRPSLRRPRYIKGFLTPEQSPEPMHHIPSSLRIQSEATNDVRGATALTTPEIPTSAPVSTPFGSSSTPRSYTHLFQSGSHPVFIPHGAPFSPPSPSDHSPSVSPAHTSSTAFSPFSHQRPQLATRMPASASPPPSPVLSRRTPCLNLPRNTKVINSSTESSASSIRKRRRSLSDSLMRIGVDVLKGVSSIGGSV